MIYLLYYEYDNVMTVIIIILLVRLVTAVFLYSNKAYVSLSSYHHWRLENILVMVSVACSMHDCTGSVHCPVLFLSPD